MAISSDGKAVYFVYDDSKVAASQPGVGEPTRVK